MRLEVERLLIAFFPSAVLLIKYLGVSVMLVNNKDNW